MGFGSMKKKFKILVVDDDAVVRNAFSSILVGQGFEVITAADGYAAINAAVSNQPDLIFLDLIMPNMDGFKTLAELRKMSRTENIPVIIVTGRTDAATLMKALKMGAFDFISKPFLQSDVIRKTRTMLSGKDMEEKWKVPLFQDVTKFASGKSYQRMRNEFILNFENAYLRMVKLLYEQDKEELKVAISRLLDAIQYYQIKSVKDKILQMLMAISGEDWDRANDLMEETYHIFQSLRRTLPTSPV